MRIVAPMPQEGGPRIPQNPNVLKNGKKSSKTQKLKNVQRYAKISDKPFDQRSLIHREAWFPGGPRIPQNPIFFEKREKSSKTQKLKNVQRYAKISDMPFDQRSVIHREAYFPPCFVRNVLSVCLFTLYQKTGPATRAYFQLLRRAPAFGRGFFCPMSQEETKNTSQRNFRPFEWYSKIDPMSATST